MLALASFMLQSEPCFQSISYYESMKFAYPPPSDGKPFRLTLGLRELSAENWLEFGEDSKNQIRERNELIDTKREVVYQVLEGYDDGKIGRAHV